MTVFNEGDILRQSIASVLQQSYADLELVIVDDGSESPRTREILDSLDDPRVKLLRQENDGLSSARNRGLRHCGGDYICFLDSDDVRAPWAFADVTSAIEETGSDLVLVSGVHASPTTRLKPFFDENVTLGAQQEAEETGALSSKAIRAWAAAYEPQSANKYIARDLIERGRLAFPNDHFFEDILFHSMVIAHARSVHLLSSRNFTYFSRQLRRQLTSSNEQIRFDIIGVAKVTFELFAQHPDFQNPRQRGAVSIGILRLLRWCEGSLPLYHRRAFRLSLAEALRQIDPLFLLIHPETPDPRRERVTLSRYANSMQG